MIEALAELCKAYGLTELRGALDVKLGIECLEATPERVVARMPVEGNTQPIGLLHGGANCTLAEYVGAVGAALHGGPGRIPVCIEISASHHRSVTSGYVTGVAVRKHGGRGIATYAIDITDDDGTLVSSARLTAKLSDI